MQPGLNRRNNYLRRPLLLGILTFRLEMCDTDRIGESDRSTAWAKVVDRVMLSFLATAATCARIDQWIPEIVVGSCSRRRWRLLESACSIPNTRDFNVSGGRY